MTTRATSKVWLAMHFPQETNAPLRTSKYYPEHELWFFTLPSTLLTGSGQGHLLFLLQKSEDPKSYHLLRVPLAFLRENRVKFDLRQAGDKFDLHISSKPSKWLVDLRSKGVDFGDFLVS